VSNLLTHSRLRTYRQCPKKHRYMYEMGYRPARVADALRFGSLIHAGLEAWWLEVQKGSPSRLGAALAAVQVEADPFDRQRAEALLEGYERAWGATAYDYEVLAVEPPFSAPLINPATGLSSRTWLLAGKVDVIAKHRASGRLLVVEHKTTSDTIHTDEDNYFQKLALDHQLSGYVVGAESLGYSIDECLYDVIRKPSLRPFRATLETERKYKKDGALYSNQRALDETPEEFGSRLRAEIESDPARYLQRREVPRLQSQIDEYLADAWITGKILRESELADRAPHNPDECFRFGRCPFWGVCTEHESLDGPGFIRSGDVHPELATNKEDTDVDSTRAAA